MIVILDFGSQYSQLIARKIRQMSVYSEIVPFNTPLAKVLSLKPEGIVLSGGPASVYAPGAPRIERTVFDAGVPVLGICYGMQLLAVLEGGEVKHSDRAEFGRTQISVTKEDDLFRGLPKQTVVWMSHQDKVSRVPRGYERLARSPNCSYVAMRHRAKPIFAVQFHPEVHHTERGEEILRNFVCGVCRAKAEWKIRTFVERTIGEVRRIAGRRRVVCAVSGGVDSTVLATLLHRAIGTQLVPVFVNNGLLREGEAETVIRRFRGLGIRAHYEDAAKHFLERLRGVVHPERKRRIIGREFVNVFFRHLGRDDFLAQGTLYPDVIETVSVRGPSATIKTHHNRVREVLRLMAERRLIEPLKELFKDEVRRVGKELGLPKEILQRQPFPGPGLAIRIIGAVTPERLALVRKADAIVVEEMKRAGLYHKVWQTFAVLLPVKSVGVMGDERTYENVCAIRAVESVDGMTADWARLPEDLIVRISNRIINEVSGINRVVYDISSKPPSTIEWE
jgi:GMP synthase (glutamine-hydrolysing)